ncbi:interferon-induced protein 44 isoform 1-T1 [Molossus nigricans]
MAVTTRLTWMQEKKLQNYLGEKQFSLLYKASVRADSAKDLLQTCYNQGPTITVIYSFDRILGAYIQENYHENKPVRITLLVFEGTEISRCEIGPRLPHRFYCSWDDRDKSSNFLIDLSEKTVKMSLGTIKELKLPENQKISFQECEVFRCEDLLDTRKMKGVTELRESLLSAIRTYKPYRDLVHQVRILLLGPTGAGKSSFFNSVKSVFRGCVTHQVLVGSGTTGTSEQYRTYSVKAENDGSPLPFMLCDSMGLSEEGGLCMDDIHYILKGHVPDRYQFDCMKPITQTNSNYIKFPLLKDRIHCVAFVFDANSIENLSNEMVTKIRRARRETIKCGVVPLVLLTCVDSMDLIRRGDIIDIYRCTPVKLKIEAVHRELGFALSDIFVVCNYTSEWALDPIKDVLNLSALRQLLWVADDFLEDLPPEEIDLKWIPFARPVRLSEFSVTP